MAVGSPCCCALRSLPWRACRRSPATAPSRPATAPSRPAPATRVSRCPGSTFGPCQAAASERCAGPARCPAHAAQHRCTSAFAHCALLLRPLQPAPSPPRPTRISQVGATGAAAEPLQRPPAPTASCSPATTARLCTSYHAPSTGPPASPPTAPSPAARLPCPQPPGSPYPARWPRPSPPAAPATILCSPPASPTSPWRAAAAPAPASWPCPRCARRLWLGRRRRSAASSASTASAPGSSAEPGAGSAPRRAACCCRLPPLTVPPFALAPAGQERQRLHCGVHQGRLLPGRWRLRPQVHLQHSQQVCGWLWWCWLWVGGRRGQGLPPGLRSPAGRAASRGGRSAAPHPPRGPSRSPRPAATRAGAAA